MTWVWTSDFFTLICMITNVKTFSCVRCCWPSKLWLILLGSWCTFFFTNMRFWNVLKNIVLISNEMLYSFYGMQRNDIVEWILWSASCGSHVYWFKVILCLSSWLIYKSKMTTESENISCDHLWLQISWIECA